MASTMVQCVCPSASFLSPHHNTATFRRALRPWTRTQISRQQRFVPCRAVGIDWSDPDTLVGAAGAVLGLGLGIGFPIFYLSRDAKDKERLEYVREMNRKRFAETGEYMTEEEIAAIRTPRWADKREFADDD